MIKAFTQILVATLFLASTSAFAAESLNCDATDLARIQQGDSRLASDYFVKQIALVQVKGMILRQAADIQVPMFLNVPGVLNRDGQQEAYRKVQASIEAELASLVPCLEAARQLVR